MLGLCCSARLMASASDSGSVGNVFVTGEAPAHRIIKADIPRHSPARRSIGKEKRALMQNRTTKVYTNLGKSQYQLPDRTIQVSFWIYHQNEAALRRLCSLL